MTLKFFGKDVKDKKQGPELQASNTRPDDSRPRSRVDRNAQDATSSSHLPRNDGRPNVRPSEYPRRHQHNPYQTVYQPPSRGNHLWAHTNYDVSPAAQQQSHRPPAVSQSYMTYHQLHLPVQDHGLQQPRAGVLKQEAALVNLIQDRMSILISAQDENEDESLALLQEEHNSSATRGTGNVSQTKIRGTQVQNTMSSTYFSKVWLYANSCLPPHLPPLKVYISTYPILCLASRYSLSAYNGPKSSVALPSTSSTSVTPIYLPSSLRLGTKAMILASHTLDTSNTIVFAIRGSATFVDWAVNFRPAPDSPAGFLDDPGNLVHNGFLAVAKAMVAPVAQRLRDVMQQNPDRWRDASLLLTGHSAGGAVASLLFCHLLSQSNTVSSELKDLAGILKRVHCVTFGAPPMSLLPLQKPSTQGMAASMPTESKRWKKSIFFAFVNEGDPVVRADRAFIRSLIALYTTPAPVSHKPSSMVGAGAAAPRPIWKVPPNNLSNAGRLVVLRPLPKERLKKRTRFLGMGAASVVDSNSGTDELIQAVLTTDEQLRTVVFGDPAMHSMKLYAQRIETLAVNAVTGNAG